MSERPIGMEEAAVELGCSRRTLTGLLGRHPYFSRPGRRNVFYRKDIEALKAAIRDETRAKCHSRSTADPVPHSGIITSSYRAVTGYEEVLEHLTRKEQRRSRKPSKNKSGDVVPMVKPQRSNSPRP